MINTQLSETEQAYAQARAYGKDLARLYTAEKNRRKEVEAVSQKFKAIFDTVSIGLVVIDNDLTIVEVNPRFLTLFEQTQDCIGLPLSEVLPVKDLLEAMQSVQTQAVKRCSVEITVNEPVKRIFLVNFSPLSNEYGWVLVLHDLTERNRLEGLKSEFINIAAHELRTPLAGVIGFASVLHESLAEADEAMVEELISLILQSTERLKTIVDELVGFAVNHPDKRDDLHIVDIDLPRLLYQSIKVLQRKIEAKNINCQVELPDEPLIIRGDQLILGEVIYHLLENAVNFNKYGGQISVRVQQYPLLTTPVEAASAVTLIEVEDTGIGIPQVELDKIFDKFYQVEEHLTRATGGLGLGLTIARSGVERHGGYLEVSSQLGQGSVFKMVLPNLSDLSEVSIDKRADMAHQQTLAYAKDMARALTQQRQMDKKLKQIKALSMNLDEKLHRLALGELEIDGEVLAQTQTIVQELVRLSN